MLQSIDIYTQFQCLTIVLHDFLPKASLLFLRHAQTRFGRPFLRKYLYETQDHAQQSPMQLHSTRLFKKEIESTLETDGHGGLVYTFGKRDYQVRYGSSLVVNWYEKLTGLVLSPCILQAWIPFAECQRTIDSSTRGDAHKLPCCPNKC